MNRLSDSTLNDLLIQAQVLRERFEEAINERELGLLEKYPIADYVKNFEENSTCGNYGKVPAEAATICEKITQSYGASSLGNYHRLVLIELVQQFEVRANTHAYHPDVRQCYEKHLRVIFKFMEKSSELRYMHDNVRFRQDFATCRHKLIPCGPELIDSYSGLCRNILLSGGLTQFIKFLSFMLHAGGFRPFYEMHLDPRLIREFNPVGWEHSYLRIAKLLENSPGILGVYGTSWWFNPQVKTLTPGLAYLSDTPTEGGAKIFYAGDSDNRALVNSPERKLAYDEGKFSAKTYIMVWARTDLIAWASNYQSITKPGV